MARSAIGRISGGSRVSEVSGHELNALLARVPSVERVMSSAALEPCIGTYGRTQVLAAVRATLDAWRNSVLAGVEDAATTPATLDEARIAAEVARMLAERAQSRLRTVFNLTGTV